VAIEFEDALIREGGGSKVVFPRAIKPTGKSRGKQKDPSEKFRFRGDFHVRGEKSNIKEKAKKRLWLSREKSFGKKKKRRKKRGNGTWVKPC